MVEGAVTRWPDEKSFMIEPTMGLKYALSIPSPLFVIRLNEEGLVHACLGPGPAPIFERETDLLS